ncbi:MAG: Lrp/AsnC family transcriptional regulator [Mycobacteriales bacterium]
MITAIVMVQAEQASIPEVAQAIADLDGVSEVYSTAGNVDLIAVVRVREFDAIAEVIPGKIDKVPGVLDTETHIAFRAYSRHDLEAAFSLGLND